MFAPTEKVGIMGKSFLVEAFAGDDNNDTMLAIFCMACTKAAQYRVSSKQCNKCWRYGHVPSLTMMAHDIGHVNHLHIMLPGEHGYYIYLNVTTYLQMWMGTQTNIMSLFVSGTFNS